MPKVSVIVPVYNVEKYISKCIDSIFNQTYTDWELILIDDGSPDRSGDICDEWAEKEERILVLHQKNGGVSVARNNGLNHATGEWVLFVDSDDWIEHNCLKVCLDTVRKENLDMLQFCYRNVGKNGEVLGCSVKESQVLGRKEFIERGAFNVCVWGGFIRSAIINDNHIRFKEGIKFAEDQLFMMECIVKSKKIQMIPNVLYNYFQNTDSATHHTISHDEIKSIEALVQFRNKYPEMLKYSDRQIAGFMMSILSKKDVTFREVINVYRLCKPVDSSLAETGSAKLFFQMAKVSPMLATWLVRLFFTFKTSR